MGQVATVKTPLSYGQALGALLAAGCAQSALLMVAAQSAVETAAWKSMHNWNMGNITPTAAQAASGDWMNQGLPMKYISYPDAVSGSRGMLQWLETHGLLSYATANDLPGYIARLKATCYLGCVGLTDPTGHTVSDQDYTNYQAGISSWMATLGKVTPEAPPGPLAPRGPSPALVIGGILVLGAAAAVAIHPPLIGRVLPRRRLA